MAATEIQRITWNNDKNSKDYSYHTPTELAPIFKSCSGKRPAAVCCSSLIKKLPITPLCMAFNGRHTCVPQYFYYLVMHSRVGNL